MIVLALVLCTTVLPIATGIPFSSCLLCGAALTLGMTVYGKLVPGTMPGCMSKINAKDFRQIGTKLRDKVRRSEIKFEGKGEESVRIRTRDRQSKLEAMVQVGNERNDIAIILTHPWGRLGGNMDFPIVKHLAKFFGGLGFTVCRFNFRGVGGSTGSATFSARGEEEDLHSVIDYVTGKSKLHVTGPKIACKSVVLIGYSYGSIIAGSLAGSREEVRALATISYPYTWNWALAVGNHRRMLNLASNAKCGLWIMGTDDDFTSASSFMGLCRGLQGDAQAVLVEGQSHHWFQAELSVACIIYDWLVKKGISTA